MDLTARLHHAAQLSHQLMQPARAGEHFQALQGQRTDHRRGLHQGAPGIMPTSEEKEPMLHHHHDQFGIQFTQRPPGMRRAPLVDLPMTLPQLEEQFNRPAFAQQDQCLGWPQMLSRRIGDDERPGGQVPLQSTDGPPFVGRLLDQPFSSLRCDFSGNAPHDQAHW